MNGRQISVLICTEAAGDLAVFLITEGVFRQADSSRQHAGNMDIAGHNVDYRIRKSRKLATAYIGGGLYVSAQT